jgi:hypothetical protein
MSSRGRLGFAVIVAVCGLQAIVTALYFRNRTVVGEEVKRREDSEALRKAAIEEQHRTAGVPIQRKRIDDFIAQTAAYADFDATAAGLNDRLKTDFDIVFDVANHSNDANPQLHFAMVLADRRVAKLFAYLNKMTPEEASRKAALLVDAKLKIHEADLATAVSDAKRVFGNPKPKEFYEIGDFPVRLNFHALHSAVFLCAAFCSPEIILSKIDKWESVAERQVSEVAADPVWNVLERSVVRYGKAEKLYLLNLFAFILEQNAGLEAQEVEQKAELKVSRFKERLPFCAWDAKTNPFDFTARHRGVPVDDSRMLMEVSFARSWVWPQDDDAEQGVILARVRKLIEQLLVADSEKEKKSEVRSIENK